MQRKGSFEHSSGATDNFFEVMPSRPLENALLASRTTITFVVDPMSEKECMSTSESLPLLSNFRKNACKLIPYPEAGEICVEFAKISLLYTTINRYERSLVISSPRDTRSIMVNLL